MTDNINAINYFHMFLNNAIQQTGGIISKLRTSLDISSNSS